MQGDVGAPCRFVDGLDRVVSFARAFPSDALFRRGSCAATDQDDALGDHEGRVETDAELADQLGGFGGVAAQTLKELTRPGLRDRADVIDRVLPRQSHPVVRYRERACGRIVTHMNAELRIVLDQGAVGHALEPQFVTGVGRVRDEFAKKDLLVAVQGVDHQMQELRDLGLESECFLRGGDRHIVDPSRCCVGRFLR
jgi:hypothetical protein